MQLQSFQKIVYYNDIHIAAIMNQIDNSWYKWFTMYIYFFTNYIHSKSTLRIVNLIHYWLQC